ncbi:hypothetical protein W97_05227 [Coniosporium apollinis CBS 100218]|uniref:Uncharacterized protein n=1 Tax=Coniosporium apollinis (strain CBS 100218) TaxID=1168221 RepID=R7YVZ5_CONA1|nr:uncharacterized protein W97_05227 [Coniosporium apollinis CBS 100218]EON65984.1 hypothetical protein W97_05227 [Coniosporium apollinis CBS 100218]
MAPDYASIWRPSDGEGTPDKTKWKICDHLPSGQLSNTNRPPTNTYLTDRVFQVVSESAISGRKKGMWWSGDFDSNGKPRISRANRGAAVLDPATGQAAVVTLSDGKQLSLVGDPEWSAPSSLVLPKSRPASSEMMKNTSPCQQSLLKRPSFSILGRTQSSQRSRGHRDSDVSMANTKNIELEATLQPHATSSDSEIAVLKARIVSLKSKTETLQGQLRTVEIAKNDYEAQATRQAYENEQLKGDNEQLKGDNEQLNSTVQEWKGKAAILRNQVQMLGDVVRRNSTESLAAANKAVNTLPLDDAKLHEFAGLASILGGDNMGTAELEITEVWQTPASLSTT